MVKSRPLRLRADLALTTVNLKGYHVTVVAEETTVEANIEADVRKFRKILGEHLAKVPANKTYGKAAELDEYMKYDMVRSVLFSIENRASFRFIGEAGIGKTSFMKYIVEKVLGLRLVTIQAAQISIENLLIPFPVHSKEFGRKVLEMVLYKHFTDTSPYVLYIDEPGRADSSLGNTIMELIQERTLAGKKLEGLRTVIATDNPEGAAYGKMSGLDFAQADRFNTSVLGSNGTPWRRALAEEFPETDLNELYKVYARLDEDIRRVLNPRVLGHMIPNVLNGFPAIETLPIIMGERVQLIDKGNNNRTTSTLKAVCEALGAQYKETLPRETRMRKYVEYCIRTGRNLFIEGGPGIGKTSFIKSVVREIMGNEPAYDSAPVLQPEDLTIPFPSEDGTSLELMPTAKFLRTEDFVWVVDEVCRASRRTQSAMMPIVQEHELGGEKIGHLRCTIGLNNPKMVAGFRLDVGKSDLAQATRYALSVQIDANDIPSKTFLYEKYGVDVASLFVEWREDDLDDTGRALCTPRCLERMIDLHLGGMDVAAALPFVGGEFVGVPLGDLRARLAKFPLARLRQIVAEVEKYEELLADPRSDIDNPEAHMRVYEAFSKADMMQLEEARDVCLRLTYYLGQQHKVALIRNDGVRQDFWFNVLRDSTKRHDDKVAAEAKAAEKKAKAAAKKA